MTRKQLVLPIALAIGLSPAALAEIATGGQASSIE
jgi:hypothetical protein